MSQRIRLELNLPNEPSTRVARFGGLFLDIGKADNLVFIEYWLRVLSKACTTQHMRSEASALDEQGLNA